MQEWPELHAHDQAWRSVLSHQDIDVNSLHCRSAVARPEAASAPPSRDIDVTHLESSPSTTCPTAEQHLALGGHQCEQGSTPQ